MAEEKSMVMTLTFDANSMFCEAVNTALEKVCKEGKIAGTLAARFSGLKLSVIGNADKIISLRIAWKDGDAKDVGAAVFEVAGGLIGAQAGSVAGRWVGATAFSQSGGWLWTPVAGGYLGDKAGSWLGEKAWEYLSENNKQLILSFAGIGDVGVQVSTENKSLFYSVSPKLSVGNWQEILQGGSPTEKNALKNDIYTFGNIGKVTTPILQPTRYFLEFEIKDGDGWGTLEAIYGPQILNLPEYGNIQASGRKFQLEVTGSELAELYYSGKLRGGDRGFAIMGDGGTLSHLSADYGADITPDSIEKGNGLKQGFIFLGQDITIFSILSKSISSDYFSDFKSPQRQEINSALIFEQKMQENFQTMLGPKNYLFVDSDTGILNQHGVLVEVDDSGNPTPTEMVRTAEQEEFINTVYEKTLRESLLPEMDYSDK